MKSIAFRIDCNEFTMDEELMLASAISGSLKGGPPKRTERRSFSSPSEKGSWTRWQSSQPFPNSLRTGKDASSIRSGVRDLRSAFGQLWQHPEKGLQKNSLLTSSSARSAPSLRHTRIFTWSARRRTDSSNQKTTCLEASRLGSHKLERLIVPRPDGAYDQGDSCYQEQSRQERQLELQEDHKGVDDGH